MKVVVQKGLIRSGKIKTICEGLKKRILIIADDKVLSYAHLVTQEMNIPILTLKAQERLKTRKTKEKLENAMLTLRYDKETLLIGIGGGITTDICGFIAATYYRGIDFMLVPTTLLAMIDSAIGGKNGVNTLFGKNLIGTFYQPLYVFVDQEVLVTLPEKEKQNGMAEMMKYGLLFDEDILKMSLEKAIKRAIEIKMKIVEEDFRDVGKRQLLNFGHTIGHAVEKASNYKISHGQAIYFGMLVESFISYKLKFLSKTDFLKITALLPKKNKLRKITKENILEALKYDKKRKNNKVHCVLLKKIAKPLVVNAQYSHEIDEKIVQSALDEMLV